jgi:hypothetical protein
MDTHVIFAHIRKGEIGRSTKRIGRAHEATPYELARSSCPGIPASLWERWPFVKVHICASCVNPIGVPMRHEFQHLSNDERQRQYSAEVERRRRAKEPLTQAILNELADEYGVKPMKLTEAMGWTFASNPNPWGNGNGMAGGV